MSHLLVDLGWVGLDLWCSTICLILLGLMGILQLFQSVYLDAEVAVNDVETDEQADDHSCLFGPD